MFGGSDRDRIRGGSSNDSLLEVVTKTLSSVDEGGDILHGDSADDRLLGGRGNDDLRGDSGSDRCNGGTGNHDSGLDCEVKIRIP